MKWCSFGPNHCRIGTVELIQIFESSHGSIFESTMYQVHIEHEFGSGLGHYYRVQIALLDPNRCHMQPYTHEKGDGDNESHQPTCTYTLIQTPMHALKHTNTTHTYIYPRIQPCMHCTHLYTYIHTNINILDTLHTYLHTHTFTQPYT